MRWIIWSIIFLLTTGLGIQALSLTEIYIGNEFCLAGEYKVHKIDIESKFLNPSGILFAHIRIAPKYNGKCAMVLLNASEYLRMQTGTPVAELIPIYTFEVDNTHQEYSKFEYQVMISTTDSYYLVIFNQNSWFVAIYYFITIFSPLYYWGLIVFTLGIIFIFIDQFHGASIRNKWLLIGIGINTGAFLCRAFMINQFLTFPETLDGQLHPEMYGDFMYFYFPWARALLDGIYPYSTQLVEYIYTPLFYYTIGIFAWLPLPQWVLAVPIFVLNIGGGYLLFQMTQRISDKNYIVIIVILGYFLNPFILIYGSFLWLNPPLFVFFIIAGLYFLQKRQILLAFFSLGISTMFKQFAILFLPLFLIIGIPGIISENKPMLSWSNLKINLVYFLKTIVAYIIPLFLISSPFLFIDATGYLDRILWNNVEFSIYDLAHNPPYITWPVTFETFFILINASETFRMELAQSLGNYHLLGISIFCIYALSFLDQLVQLFAKHPITPKRKDIIEIQRYFYYCYCIVCLLQIFYPRGSYKYYLILLVPFLALLPLQHQLTKKYDMGKYSKGFTLFFLGSELFLCWILFWMNRYFYFWILIGSMIIFGIGLSIISIRQKIEFKTKGA